MTTVRRATAMRPSALYSEAVEEAVHRVLGAHVFDEAGDAALRERRHRQLARQLEQRQRVLWRERSCGAVVAVRDKGLGAGERHVAELLEHHPVGLRRRCHPTVKVGLQRGRRRGKDAAVRGQAAAGALEARIVRLGGLPQPSKEGAVAGSCKCVSLGRDCRNLSM